MPPRNLIILIMWVALFPTFSLSRDTLSLRKNGNDDALFLTPYIESGRIEEAQQLATVAPMLKDDESFAGYLTVNKSCNSNMFFWFFKSQQGNWESRPLVVWLQGGPGETAIFGLLRDVGPFFVDKNRKLKRRKYSWNRKCNLLFIDNPIGAGYSFTDTDSGYATSESDVARDLYEALIQLHKLFPALRKNKVAIVGESYAGKFAVAIAYKIYKMNQVSAFRLNLERLILASAFVDPFTLVKYGDYLYGLGFLDKAQQLKFLHREEEFRADIKAGAFQDAVHEFSMERYDVKNLLGIKGVSDFAYDAKGLPMKAGAIWFVNRTETRTALHLGDSKLNYDSEVISHLGPEEFVKSVQPWLEELLAAELFPIIFLNGQLDILTAYSITLEFFNSLKWPHARDYYKARRCQFKVGDRVAAYYRSAGTFTEILLRNTGHLIAASKPKWAFEVLDKLITNVTFFECV